ncbi:hypothetical protein [Nocardioides sp.]|uniref:WXG100-like domain-containing protein n=1 Tax=Nocardioides sp. TaxID=35761 RepID=UPI0039E3A315
MAILLPDWFTPVFSFYGLRWPDVDEDKLADFGDTFKSMCDSLVDFGNALNHLLGVLSENSESDAYESLVEEWSVFCSTDLNGKIELVGDATKIGCDTVATSISLYKTGLITTLSFDIAADIAAISTGVGIAAFAAKKAMARVILLELMEWAAQETADFVKQQLNDAFDNLILHPIEMLRDRIRDQLVDMLADVVSTNPDVRASVSGTAAALYIDHHEVIDAVVKLKASYDGLCGSVNGFRAILKAADLTDSQGHGAERDPIVRTALEAVLEWAIEAMVGLLVDVGEQVVDNLLELITRTYEKYVEADTELGALAKDLRDQLKFPPLAQPYLIDRSTRPAPIRYWEAPPEIIQTGEAASQARFDITVIDLPDIADPVLTGPAESEARLDIRQIVLDLDLEPVVTGPAESDARDRIRRVELPDLTPRGDA